VSLLVACDYREDLSYTPPESPGPTEETVTLQDLRIRVVQGDGTPRSGVLLGTIPTLNPRETVVGSDGNERAMTTERYLTGADGEYSFGEMTLPIATSPIFVQAYVVDQELGTLERGTTFVDLESGMDAVQVRTIVLEDIAHANAGIKTALFDPEPFPRGIDFFTLEGIAFDNLVYQYYAKGHDWPDWDTSDWDDILSATNLARYSVLAIGFDASKYAEFDQLVKHQQALIDFVTLQPDRLLFILQQNTTGFNWSWVADFDVPQRGIDGGFLQSVYLADPHFANAAVTSFGVSHPLLAGSALVDATDADQDGVADIWEGWEHIEPNKPEVKDEVVWHAGNASVFETHGWDILVRAPAIQDEDVPPGAGVVLASKAFPNGSRIVFANATYYQGSYGPRKALPAILLRDRIVQLIRTWPALREP
jgi:hypothetical protein